MSTERERLIEEDNRRTRREIIAFLKSDLFEEERYEGDEPLRAFRNPGGFRVVFGKSCSGWVEHPDGSLLLASSHLDVARLDEVLP